MIADVAVPFRVPRTFHYSIPDEMSARVRLGAVVRVPFRSRSTFGFVLGLAESASIEPSRLKAVDEILVEEPLFDEASLKFLRWVSSYYCHPLGEVLAAAIPKQAWQAPSRKAAEKRKTAKAIEIEAIGEVSPPPALTSEQAAALVRILEPGETRPFLLHGVTGSGKTEVYMRALERVVAEGKGGIVLVPEISLTPQLLGRFSSRFAGRIAVLHSHLTPRERYWQWQRVLSGEASVVIGARSAVFAPVRDLGLIVVDEEQEASFKQEDSLRYNARDVAVLRGALGGAKVVLGSATPSVESFANARGGKYVYLSLKKRVAERPLPKALFVDLRQPGEIEDPRRPWLSRTLGLRIEETLARGGQCLLYLNRLGFAHFLFCADCGHAFQCRNCDLSLTFYRQPPALKCHHCGLIERPPDACPKCGGLRLQTMGVGTEQVEDGLKGRFPLARVARMDRSEVRTRKDLESLLSRIAKGEVDIVIGTQMIAKGHDFPGIQLVGILVADASLNLPDFRAHERTFQAVTQVAGRAGRAGHPGEVVIQTLNPDHPVLRAAAENRAEEFYENELAAREKLAFPPFCRLAVIRFAHANRDKAMAFARSAVLELARASIEGLAVLGPAEAPLARVNKLYRWQCLIKARSPRAIQQAVARLEDLARRSQTAVQVSADIDPATLL